MPPVPNNKRPARSTEAERRYRYAPRNRRRPATVTALRVRELNIVRERRYGETIPDSRAGRDLCKVVALHMAYHADAERRIPSWLDLRAPFLDDDEQCRITREAIAAVARGLRPWSADKLGWHLRISMAERKEWGLTTIGAIADSKAKRKERRREKDRAYQAEKRRKAGAKPRAKSAEQLKPWKALNMSRATWYRRKKAATYTRPETDSSAATLMLITDDASVSLTSGVSARPRTFGAKGARFASGGLQLATG